MILRAIPMKDATATALTSCGAGPIFDIGSVYPGVKAYAGLHILGCSTGGVQFYLENSSSSAGGGMTTRFTFTCSAGRAAEMLTPLTTGTLTSTVQPFWRASWQMTTSGESYKALPFIGIQ